MAQYLKGNYKLPKKMKPQVSKMMPTVEQKFEQESLAKLGGSIAFIMKSKTFLWEGDKDEKTD